MSMFPKDGLIFRLTKNDVVFPQVINLVCAAVEQKHDGKHNPLWQKRGSRTRNDNSKNSPLRRAFRAFRIVGRPNISINKNMVESNGVSKFRVEPSIELNHGGGAMPRIGFGTSGIKNPDQVCSAIRAGYRHIDTAAYYKNEEVVG